MLGHFQYGHIWKKQRPASVQDRDGELHLFEVFQRDAVIMADVILHDPHCPMPHTERRLYELHRSSNQRLGKLAAATRITAILNSLHACRSVCPLELAR